ACRETRPGGGATGPLPPATPAGAARLDAALDLWIASRAPQADAHALADPLTGTMCAPGTDVDQTLVSDDATDAMFTRGNLLDVLLARTHDLDRASCAVDALVHEFPVAELNGGSAAVEARIDQLATACP